VKNGRNEFCVWIRDSNLCSDAGDFWSCCVGIQEAEDWFGEGLVRVSLLDKSVKKRGVVK
jgi:hypothetical protein